MPKQPNDKSRLDETKRLMGALMKMKPKPHEEMKVGMKNKPTAKPKKQK